MSETFACPDCRMLLEVSSRQLGKQVRCPVCGLISVFGSPVGDSPEDAGKPGDAGEWRRGNEPKPREYSAPDEPKRPLPTHQPNAGAPKKNSESWRPIAAGTARGSADPWRRPPPPGDPLAGPPFAVGGERTAADLQWKVGFFASLAAAVGAVFPCLCCVGFPLGTLILSIVGLAITATSNRGPRLINYCLAGTGLVVSLVGCGLLVLRRFFGL